MRGPLAIALTLLALPAVAVGGTRARDELAVPSVPPRAQPRLAPSSAARQHPRPGLAMLGSRRAGEFLPMLPSPAGGPEVLFTFDDGPSPGRTAKVLEILEARGIKAVFFVNGRRFQGDKPLAEQARDLLREMVRRGHAIGNHTLHHYGLCGRAYRDQATQEIVENADLIEHVTGLRPDLFRTPFGSTCRTLAATLESLGLQPTGWDIDPQDWKVRDPAKIEAYVQQRLRRLRGRAILLLHDVQPATVTALPRILSWIDKENAARLKKGRPAIKIANYSFLFPDRPLVPPALDSLARLLLGFARLTGDSPVAFWPPLAWPADEV